MPRNIKLPGAVNSSEEEEDDLVVRDQTDFIAFGSNLANATEANSVADTAAMEAQYGKGGLQTRASKLLKMGDVDKQGRKLRKNILFHYETKELLEPTKKDLTKIWAYFDADGGGTLEGFEIRVMAIEVIERTILFLAEELRSRTKLNASQLDSRTLDEAYFYLPGECNSDDEMIKDMILFIATTMDPGCEGDITKLKFINLFQTLARRLWVYHPPPKSVCSIL